MTRGEIRAQIKSDAKRQLAANNKVMILANLFISILITIPTLIIDNVTTSYVAYILLLTIPIFIGTPLTIGFYYMSINCARGEKIQFKDIFKIKDRLDKIYLVTLIQYIIMAVLTIPLAVIPIALAKDNFFAIVMMQSIILIANTFFMIIFAQVEYIVADKKDISSIEAIKKSIIMMKGHAIDYIILNLSLIGWILLVGFTFGIAYIWVGPYIQLVYTNFYEYVKSDKLDTYKKSKRNNVAIGIIIGILLCGYVVAEQNIKEVLLTPKVVKNVLKENDLKLISSDESIEYYISAEESEAYNIDIDHENLIKYTVRVKNHKLDSKKGDNIDSTIVYIIADNDKVLGVSCEPYESTTIINGYNPIPGKYDLNGGLLNGKK